MTPVALKPEQIMDQITDQQKPNEEISQLNSNLKDQVETFEQICNRGRPFSSNQGSPSLKGQEANQNMKKAAKNSSKLHFTSKYENLTSLVEPSSQHNQRYLSALGERSRNITYEFDDQNSVSNQKMTLNTYERTLKILDENKHYKKIKVKPIVNENDFVYSVSDEVKSTLSKESDQCHKQNYQNIKTYLADSHKINILDKVIAEKQK